MSVWDSMTDEAVLSTCQKNFNLLTGVVPFTPKGSGKSDIPIQEFTFINAMAFFNTFPIAVRRGLLSPAEIALGQELFDLIDAL